MKYTTIAGLLAVVLAGSPAGAYGQNRPAREPSGAATGSNLLRNGGFEGGLAGWAPFWSRAPGAGTAALDHAVAREGKAALRIEHKAEGDWSEAAANSIAVQAGEIYEFSGWLRREGPGRAELSVVLRDEAGRVIDWSYAAASAGPSGDWRPLRSRFMIPRGARELTPRAVGHGPATVWLDGLVLLREREAARSVSRGTTDALILKNHSVDVTLDPADGRLRALDRKTGQLWTQRPAGPELMVKAARKSPNALEIDLVDPASLVEFTARLWLDAEHPELLVELSGDGPLGRSLAFPYPFESEPDSYLVLPVNEGMSYPVDDPSLPEMHYILYGGHGLCMAWWGVTDGKLGMMAIVETPDDASIRVARLQGRLSLAPLWDAQKGQLGPNRRIRYVFLSDGGHVAMAKRYRQHAQATGLFKTLNEKRSENPEVDRLIGAVNVWCWDGDPVATVRELKSAGIERILWSAGGSAEAMKSIAAMGALTSRYDIYQDVMDPATFPKLRGIHPDWTTKAWPADLMRDSSGDWIRGWEVEGRDGKMYPCGVTCDRQAVGYAIDRIGRELKNQPYLCRFIDTTTASPWRECYDSRHPLTRSESRHWKMELLRAVSEHFHLVTGSETGHDAAVPFVHYFEGMLSLGPYRLDDAGRAMQRIVQDVPPQISRFQTGAFYRLPLWELVYHDCVVAQWYWGDYNNKLPAVWDRRDLFNALYGTPPMFMFSRRLWEKERERFVKSYRTVCPIARSTGYSEMLSHRWVTSDHNVQETTFASGQTVTINLGHREYRFPDGQSLPPMGLRVQGGRPESARH
jgi:hypothetical protein